MKSIKYFELADKKKNKNIIIIIIFVFYKNLTPLPKIHKDAQHKVQQKKKCTKISGKKEKKRVPPQKKKKKVHPKKNSGMALEFREI